WVVELACDRTALPAEERLARDRLPGLEFVAGELAHALRDLADSIEPQVRPDAVEGAERQRDLGEARVPGALAHAVDRPLDPTRPGLDGGHGGRGRQPEVVVAVEVDGNVRPRPSERA